MFNLDIEFEPGVLERGIEDTLLKVEEMNEGGKTVIYFNLVKKLEKEMGDNVAAIILKTEECELIGRAQIKQNGNAKVRPIIITDKGRKRLEEIKKNRKINK